METDDGEFYARLRRARRAQFLVDDLRCSGRHRTDFRIRQMFRLVGNLTVDTYAEGQLGVVDCGPSRRRGSNGEVAAIAGLSGGAVQLPEFDPLTGAYGSLLGGTR